MLTRTKILAASAAAVVLVGVGGAAIADGMHKRGHGKYVGKMFEMLDANKDGKVTKEEARSFRDSKFAEFDGDASGELSIEEYTALVNSFVAQHIQKRFERQDKDGSGGLTKDEVVGRMAKMFDKLDQNDDGAIEKTELRKWHKHKDHHGDEDKS